VSTSSDELEELRHRLCASVDRHRPQLEEISLNIHRTPEVAFQEHRAAAWLTHALETGGFEVERRIAGLDTAFVARYRGGEGPVVALLAEYDALPGVGHGCCHNLIGTSAVGAAVALKEAVPDLPGTILVVGSPAEETGGGKAHLVEAGVFEGVRAAMMVHHGPVTQAVAPLIAMQEIRVEYRGKASHASSQPQDGRNALDALVLSYMSIAALRQHIRKDARVHGIITDGGTAANVVPDYAAGRFYVRAKDDEYQSALQERVLSCFRAGGEATGTRMEYGFPSKRYSAMRNNPTIVNAFRANLALLGIEEIPPDPNRSYGSTDMGNVSSVVPAIHPILAVAPSSTPAHSLEMAQYAGSDAGREGLARAAKLMALTVLDLLQHPDLLETAWEEFRDGKEAALWPASN